MIESRKYPVPKKRTLPMALAHRVEVIGIDQIISWGIWMLFKSPFF